MGFRRHSGLRNKTLEEPVKRPIEKGAPVIDMDTCIVPPGQDIGLWTLVTPGHKKLAEVTTETIVEKMGYKGKMIHTQGALALRLTRGRPIFDIPPFLTEIGGGGIPLFQRIDASGATHAAFSIPIITLVAATALFGGKGGIPNTVVGLLTFGVLYNGLNHVEIDIYLKQFISGVILLAGLVLNVAMARIRSAQRVPAA